MMYHLPPDPTASHHQHTYTHVPQHGVAPVHHLPPPPIHQPAPPPPDANSARRHGTNSIGAPQHFEYGPFAGMTVRAQLTVVQNAEMARKCADPPRTVQRTVPHTMMADGSSDRRAKPGKKDRRPLDPPPVVQLRLFRVFDEGTSRQIEEEIPTESIIQDTEFICHAELFPYVYTSGSASPMAATSVSPTVPTSRRRRAPTHSPTTPVVPTYADAHSQSPTSPNSVPPYPFTFTSALPMSAVRQPDPPTVEMQYPTSSVIEDLEQPQGHVVLENNQTQALIGSTYAHAASLIDLGGNRVIYFVFSDLAVKLEGTFALRFRFFDLRSMVFGGGHGSRPPEPVVPVLAEALGGPFAVYSTKQFGGLRASTELTKHLARFGIKVNVREQERKRKRPRGGNAGASNGGGGSGADMGGVPGVSVSIDGVKIRGPRLEDDDSDLLESPDDE